MRIRYGPEIFYLQRYGGISKYITRLAEEMNKIGSDSKIIAPVYSTSEIQNCLIRGIKAPHFRGSHKIYYYLNSIFTKISTREKNVDIFHCSYYRDISLASKNSKKIITIHDMAHELIPEYFSKRDKTSYYKYKALLTADKIICISNTTKKNLLKVYPEIDKFKVETIKLGYDSYKINKRENKDTEPYILFVGNRGGYKNFLSFIEGVGQDKDLKNNVKIKLFGGGRLNSDELKIIKSLGIKDEIIDYIEGAHKDLNNLYSNALCFVFPSLHEGFGLPLLEAMSAGCPVLCSDIEVFREIAGNAALYFDPMRVNLITEKIKLIMNNKFIRNEQIALGLKKINEYSWGKCGIETFKLYQDALNE